MRENWLNEDYLLHDQTAQFSHLINGRREQESAPPQSSALARKEGN